jgi:hypothetical protein
VAYVLVAIVVGLVIGRLTGGRFTNLAAAPVRWWPVLVGAIVVQVAAVLTDGDVGVVLLLVSFGLIILFTAVNLTTPGMGIVLIGVAMNALVIGVNQGMPVRQSAIVASGLADEGEAEGFAFNSKWHLETEEDRLTFLGDIIPVPGAREVLSFGDLVMAVGVADVIVHLMRKPRAPAATTSDAPAPATAD